MVINYNNFINTENESNEMSLFNNDKKRFINKKIYFKFVILKQFLNIKFLIFLYFYFEEQYLIFTQI